MNKPELRLTVVPDRAIDGSAPAGPGPAITGPDRLEYMADLIVQLKGMAEEHGCATLGGILEVAYQEAKSQACRR